MEIGDKIRVLRTRKGLSQEALALKVDSTKDHIGKLERAEIKHEFFEIVKIADFFEVPLDYFR